jgi:hypothetical protein
MSAAIFNQGFFHAFAVGPYPSNPPGPITPAHTLYEHWGNPSDGVPFTTNAIPGTEGLFDPLVALDIARIVDDPGNPLYAAYFVTGRIPGNNNPIIALWTGDHWEVH